MIAKRHLQFMVKRRVFMIVKMHMFSQRREKMNATLAITFYHRQLLAKAFVIMKDFAIRKAVIKEKTRRLSMKKNTQNQSHRRVSVLANLKIGANTKTGSNNGDRRPSSSSSSLSISDHIANVRRTSMITFIKNSVEKQRNDLSFAERRTKKIITNPMQNIPRKLEKKHQKKNRMDPIRRKSMFSTTEKELLNIGRHWKKQTKIEERSKRLEIFIEEDDKGENRDDDDAGDSISGDSMVEDDTSAVVKPKSQVHHPQKPHASAKGGGETVKVEKKKTTTDQQHDENVVKIETQRKKGDMPGANEKEDNDEQTSSIRDDLSSQSNTRSVVLKNDFNVKRYNLDTIKEEEDSLQEDEEQGGKQKQQEEDDVVKQESSESDETKKTPESNIVDTEDSLDEVEENKTEDKGDEGQNKGADDDNGLIGEFRKTHTKFMEHHSLVKKKKKVTSLQVKKEKHKRGKTKVKKRKDEIEDEKKKEDKHKRVNEKESKKEKDKKTTKSLKIRKRIHAVVNTPRESRKSITKKKTPTKHSTEGKKTNRIHRKTSRRTNKQKRPFVRRPFDYSKITGFKKETKVKSEEDMVESEESSTDEEGEEDQSMPSDLEQLTNVGMEQLWIEKDKYFRSTMRSNTLTEEEDDDSYDSDEDDEFDDFHELHEIAIETFRRRYYWRKYFQMWNTTIDCRWRYRDLQKRRYRNVITGGFFALKRWRMHQKQLKLAAYTMGCLSRKRKYLKLWKRYIRLWKKIRKSKIVQFRRFYVGRRIVQSFQRYAEDIKRTKRNKVKAQTIYNDNSKSKHFLYWADFCVRMRPIRIHARNRIREVSLKILQGFMVRWKRKVCNRKLLRRTFTFAMENWSRRIELTRPYAAQFRLLLTLFQNWTKFVYKRRQLKRMMMLQKTAVRFHGFSLKNKALKRWQRSYRMIIHQKWLVLSDCFETWEKQMRSTQSKVHDFQKYWKYKVPLETFFTTWRRFRSHSIEHRRREAEIENNRKVQMLVNRLQRAFLRNYFRKMKGNVSSTNDSQDILPVTDIKIYVKKKKTKINVPKRKRSRRRKENDHKNVREKTTRITRRMESNVECRAIALHNKRAEEVAQSTVTEDDSLDESPVDISSWKTETNSTISENVSNDRMQMYLRSWRLWMLTERRLQRRADTANCKIVQRRVFTRWKEWKKTREKTLARVRASVKSFRTLKCL
eukprot:g1142.t1